MNAEERKQLIEEAGRIKRQYQWLTENTPKEKAARDWCRARYEEIQQLLDESPQRRIPHSSPDATPEPPRVPSSALPPPQEGSASHQSTVTDGSGMQTININVTHGHAERRGVPGLAITSLVLGVVAFTFSWVPIFACMLLPATIIGGVFGIQILASANQEGRGMAIAGVVLCGIALVVTFLNVLAIAASL